MKKGSLYAVSTGVYLGEFFVYMNSNNKQKNFLSLPKMINRSIDDKNIEHAVKKGILEFQEVLPVHIIDVCTKQYEKNLHRRK